MCIFDWQVSFSRMSEGKTHTYIDEKEKKKEKKNKTQVRERERERRSCSKMMHISFSLPHPRKDPTQLMLSRYNSECKANQICLLSSPEINSMNSCTCLVV